MRRTTLFLFTFAAFLFFVETTIASSFLHAPHNETNGITCVTCHEYPLNNNVWPPDFPPPSPTQDDTFRNFLCLKCHGNSGSAPTMAMHSSLIIQGRIASFTTECVDCHDPHFQAQLNWIQQKEEELYLATGHLTSVIPQNNTTVLRYSNLTHDQAWSDLASWGQKTGAGRGLVLVISKTTPSITFEIISADNSEIIVNGNVDVFYNDQDFGIIYGQLIRDRISFQSIEDREVQFFDPRSLFTDQQSGEPTGGGFVELNDSQNSKTTPVGICQVCHLNTNYFRTDFTEPDPNHPPAQSSLDCTVCHLHKDGFAATHSGSAYEGGAECAGCHNTGHHAPHLISNLACSDCHDPNNIHDGQGNVFFKDGQNLANTTACGGCHYNPTTGGSPNRADFKTGWFDVSYPTLACAGCHNGRPNIDNNAVMASYGHDTLVGEAWIRQYPCSFCHFDSVDEEWHLLASHTNNSIDVSIDPQWAIAGQSAPDFNSTDKTCNFTYCHSDGTTVDPDMREYVWTGGHQDCYSCHGHDPTFATCSGVGCHSDGRDGTYWNSIPEKRWLSAMPMYENTGPGTSRANSHFRHLFTGFSCDDCHFNTVEGGSCLECHGTTVPTGDMFEAAHVDATYHVNRSKDVVFKDGGTFNAIDKTCSNTFCHTGGDPQWGDTVDNIPCRDCHGTTNADVDDFGKFNDTRAKINLVQWETTGHGRPTSAGNYPHSDNPPANFPEKGCWYCHDNKVLHQDEGRPFRLREHDQFNQRFEKECVFCHMTESDAECVGCHNDAGSIAPQLVEITQGSTPNPPYTIPRPLHDNYVDGNGVIITSCATATCHEGDSTRHNTEAGTWSEPEKEDIKNNYVKMGVCLKCHDDDSNDRCIDCHTGPQYTIGFDPGLPGTSFIKPVQARASSMHFGYKHFEAYEQSLAADLDSGTTSSTGITTREAIDATKSWIDDEWIDKYLVVTSGAHSGFSRLIISNTSDTLRFTRPLPDGLPLSAGETYAIKDIVWKGGKFCWDCHDPHGDDNIYMIQNMAATRTDGWAGKPFERATVTFTRKQSGLDYARTSAPYDGLCNVCHSEGGQHYAKDKGDGHNSSRVCTQCHEHRFTDSHASGESCSTCHDNRPVPRHTAFSLPRDCTKCHAGTIGKRMNIMGQFVANSHHVQDVEVTNKHCYACHWEATPEGLIDNQRHQGFNYKTYQSTIDGPVDLVIWSEEESPGIDDNPTVGSRPTVYDPDGTHPDGNGKPTVAFFTAADMALSQTDERREVKNITPHCLGCHSDQNNDAQPFDDCKTPRQYAWDRSSVASRYADPDTTTWGKYSQYPDAAQKDITKAFSAHGNAKNNGGGWSDTTGVDANIPNTRDGTYGDFNIQCFDCHSSHGSKVIGITSSYATFDGSKNGANLKETQAGKGGYNMTYKASANLDPNSINPYNAGAGQCFDCHETEFAGTTPWGYKSTFGASEAIMGYPDTPRFGQGQRGVNLRYPYKTSAISGGHFKPSSDLTSTPMGTIDGLCTPCHDPHGVSKTLGPDKDYAVPMLKGTWLTSPYKEDAANDDGVTGPRGSEAFYRNAANGPTPTPYVYTDQRTLGAEQVSETDTLFAGLCLRCHMKDSLTDGTNNNGAWKTVDRIHESVKGWGDNEMHSYTCSKCHVPHSSSLPRLMITNCLNVSHRGQVPIGGMPASNDELLGYNNCDALVSYTASFPFGRGDTKGSWENYQVNCHPNATWPDNEWNQKTPW